MKCPKCQAKLQFFEPGYAKVNANEGDAAPLAGHTSCWRCGYYKDLDCEPIAKMTKEMIQKVQQPLSKKIIEGSEVKGIITEIVKKNYASLAQLSARGNTWKEITNKYDTMYPEHAPFNPIVLRTAFHRAKASKTANAINKGARADKKSYTRKADNHA